MMKQDDDKALFTRFAIIRVVGLLLFLSGVFIAFTDIVRVSGFPAPGVLLGLAGLVITLSALRLAKHFSKQ